jgi:two-component system sensor histidine kinase DesK
MSTLVWLPTVIRVAIAPVLIGAAVYLSQSARSPQDLAAGAGLLLLGAIHVIYWWHAGDAFESGGRTDRPTRQSPAAAAVIGMAAVNLVLLDLLGLAQPLVWLYPTLIAGAGLRARWASVGIGLTAVAAAAPLAFQGQLVHPAGPLPPAEVLGPGHSVLLSIVLAGLGMMAVRQLIALNRELHATRAELADLAVADERNRLGRELHDLLGRTLSLIAVKAELASRLSARGDSAANEELADVQRLARQAIRDVRDAVTGEYSATVAAELASAEVALNTAGIELTTEISGTSTDPTHDSTFAWAIREAVTNVLKHSGARTCHIALHTTDRWTTLTIEDDGRGVVEFEAGTGLDGLADRVRELGGNVNAGPGELRGFRLEVQLGPGARERSRIESPS